MRVRGRRLAGLDLHGGENPATLDQRLEQRAALRVDSQVVGILGVEQPGGGPGSRKYRFGDLTRRLPKFRVWGGSGNTMQLASRTESRLRAVL